MRLHNPPAHLIFLLNAGKQFTSMFHKLVAEARKTSAIRNRGRFGGNGIAQPDRILVARNFNCKNVCKMSVGILGNIRKSSLANPRRRCSVTTSSLPGIISGSNTIPSRPSAVRFACFSLTVCRNSLSMISPGGRRTFWNCGVRYRVVRRLFGKLRRFKSRNKLMRTRRSIIEALHRVCNASEIAFLRLPKQQ